MSRHLLLSRRQGEPVPPAVGVPICRMGSRSSPRSRIYGRDSKERMPGCLKTEPHTKCRSVLVLRLAARISQTVLAEPKLPVWKVRQGNPPVALSSHSCWSERPASDGGFPVCCLRSCCLRKPEAVCDPATSARQGPRSDLPNKNIHKAFICEN